MAGILTSLRCAIQAVMIASYRTCRLAVFGIVLQVLHVLPEKLIPNSMPKRWLKKDFGVGVSYKTFLQLVWVQYIHKSCPIKIGLKAPNIDILTLDNVKKKLLDFEKVGRPLVVNFGSCS